MLDSPQLFAAIDQSLNAATANLEPLALSLIGSLAVIRLVWLGLEMALEGGSIDRIGGPLIKALMVIFFVLWAAKGGAIELIGGVVDGAMTALGAGSGQLQDLAAAGLNMTTAAIGQTLAAIGLMIKPFGGGGVLDVIQRTFTYIGPIVVLLFTALLFVVTGLVYFVTVALGAVLLKVAVIVAPLFLPFLILPQTSFLADGWIRFAIGAALYKPIAFVVASLAGGLVSTIHTTLATIPYNVATATADAMVAALVTALSAAALALLILYMLMQVPNIATSLVGGASISVGGMIHGARMAMPRGMTPQMPKPPQPPGSSGGSGGRAAGPNPPKPPTPPKKP